jgi:hypothetical protein
MRITERYSRKNRIKATQVSPGMPPPPDYALEFPAAPKLKLQPMSDLDLKIFLGWGDTPQHKLPEDWRTRKNPVEPPAKRGKKPNGR